MSDKSIWRQGGVANGARTRLPGQFHMDIVSSTWMFSTHFDRQYISCSLEYLVLRALQLLYTVDSPSCTLSSRAYPTHSEVSNLPSSIPLVPMLTPHVLRLTHAQNSSFSSYCFLQADAAMQLKLEAMFVSYESFIFVYPAQPTTVMYATAHSITSIFQSNMQSLCWLHACILLETFVPPLSRHLGNEH